MSLDLLGSAQMLAQSLAKGDVSAREVMQATFDQIDRLNPDLNSVVWQDREAAMAAAKLRFRPILMTAFSFILGVLPLLVASGAGAEARKVMGMTVFSGMLVATVVGVLIVPALYVIVERYISRSKPAAHTEQPATTPEGQ